MNEFFTQNFVVIALLLFMAFMFIMTLWSIMTANGKQYLQLSKTIETERGQTRELYEVIGTLTTALNETQAISLLRTKKEYDNDKPRRMHRSDSVEAAIEDGEFKPAPVDQYG